MITYGDTLARLLASLIHTPVATTAALTATPADDRSDNQLFLVTADDSFWAFSLTSTADLAAGILAPDAGSGRFIRMTGGAAAGGGTKLVRFASTGNLAGANVAGVLTESAANGALGTIDGVTPAVGDRCLLKNQSTGADNGLYTVTALGDGSHKWVLTRALDANAASNLLPGLQVLVSEGTANANTVWELATAAPLTINTTSLAFKEIGTLPSATVGNTLGVTGAGTIGYGALNLAGGAGYVSGVLPVGNMAFGTNAQIPVTNAGATALAFVTVSGDFAITAAGVGTVSKVNGIVPFAIAPCLAVAVANQATLTGLAQTIDGVALSSIGQRVFLANQTTPAQNGIWVVQSGAWTRPTDWATGATPPLGTIITIAPGGTSNFATYGSQWFVQATAVIDTGTVTSYPKTYRQLITLSSGTYKIGFGGGSEALWLLAGATVSATYNTPNTITASVALKSAAAGRTAGLPGAGFLSVTAVKADSTTNAADVSTVDVLVTNG